MSSKRKTPIANAVKHAVNAYQYWTLPEARYLYRDRGVDAWRYQGRSPVVKAMRESSERDWRLMDSAMRSKLKGATRRVLLAFTGIDTRDW